MELAKYKYTLTVFFAQFITVKLKNSQCIIPFHFADVFICSSSDDLYSIKTSD